MRQVNDVKPAMAKKKANGMTEKERRTENRNTSKKAALYGLFLALALVASWLERLIPVSPGIPGVKMGLANLVTMVLLYTAGLQAAFTVTCARILLSGLLFGNAFSMAYSFAGAILSMAVMILLRKTGLFSVTGVSIAGGVFHNVGQILVAMAVLGMSALLYYLPFLIIAGLIAGTLIGLLSGILIRRLSDVIRDVLEG